MRRIIVFGNSGSGKSTLAAKYREAGLAHLDLDVLAWLASDPPQRRPLDDAFKDIEAFVSAHAEWIIEGCYADLLEMLKPYATQAIFMNLPVHLCQENARNRPWEPHKYASKQAQDENLEMLLDWIGGYMDRQDALSHSAHQALYKSFEGEKKEIRCNPDPESQPDEAGQG